MVVIVVCCHDSDRWIEKCVNYLTRTVSQPFEIMLVDNGGNSRLKALIGGPRVLLKAPASDRPLPFSEVNNFAVAYGGLESELVCFLNQDTISRQDWLTPCVDVLRRDVKVGAVMPLIENYDGTAWDEAFVSCSRAAPFLYDRLQEGVRATFD
ncbi:MAG: hypothetical protein QXT77_09645, partial [Candidatus Methanomethylicaceae archaeon]